MQGSENRRYKIEVKNPGRQYCMENVFGVIIVIILKIILKISR